MKIVSVKLMCYMHPVESLVLCVIPVTGALPCKLSTSAQTYLLGRVRHFEYTSVNECLRNYVTMPCGGDSASVLVP